MRDPREQRHDVLEVVTRHASGERAEYGANELVEVRFLRNRQGRSDQALPDRKSLAQNGG